MQIRRFTQSATTMKKGCCDWLAKIMQFVSKLSTLSIRVTQRKFSIKVFLGGHQRGEIFMVYGKVTTSDLKRIDFLTYRGDRLERDLRFYSTE